MFPTRSESWHTLDFFVIQVKDLGSVLHLIGGTAACYIIFFLPGMLLINSAIVKQSESSADLAGAAQAAVRFRTA